MEKSARICFIIKSRLKNVPLIGVLIGKVCRFRALSGTHSVLFYAVFCSAKDSICKHWRINLLLEKHLAFWAEPLICLMHNNVDLSVSLLLDAGLVSMHQRSSSPPAAAHISPWSLPICGDAPQRLWSRCSASLCDSGISQLNPPFGLTRGIKRRSSCLNDATPRWTL